MRATGTLTHAGRLPKAPPSLVGFGLLLPAMTVVGLFQIYPLVRGVVLSLRDAQTGALTTHNYDRMLHDPVWHAAVANVSKILLLVPLFVVVPLLLAFALFQAFRGWRFFRAVFFLSWLMPPVIVGYMFTPLMHADGPLHGLLAPIGLGWVAHDWLSDPHTALWAVMAVFLWTIFGLGVGIYLAGLATIPAHLIEAGRLDGASRLRILRHVVAPLLAPTIALWSVMVVASLLLGLYGFIYSLTNGGPGYSTMTPEYYIVSVLLNEINPSYAAALGTTLFVGVFAIVLVQMAAVYRRVVAD